MIAACVPPGKVGVYMGIHNIFLVLPQLAAAATLGVVVDRLLDGQPGQVIILASAALMLAALLTFVIPGIDSRER